jgi:hypothetical protein
MAYFVGYLIGLFGAPVLLMGGMWLLGRWLPWAKRWATAAWTLMLVLFALTGILLVLATVVASPDLSEAALGSLFVIGAYTVVRVAGEWRWRIWDAEDKRRFLEGNIGHGGWPLLVQWLILVAGSLTLVTAFVEGTDFARNANFFGWAAAWVGGLLIVGTVWDIADRPGHTVT